METKTVEILMRTGWYEGRKIDTRDIETKFKKARNFELFDTAKRFISEFGSLEIELPRLNEGMSEQDIIKYNTPRFKKYSTDVSHEYTAYEEDYEEYVNEKIDTVGSLEDGHISLMISESGRLFCQSGFIGDNAEDFWDKLINKGEKGYIIHWENWGGMTD